MQMTSILKKIVYSKQFKGMANGRMPSQSV